MRRGPATSGRNSVGYRRVTAACSADVLGTLDDSLYVGDPSAGSGGDGHGTVAYLEGGVEPRGVLFDAAFVFLITSDVGGC